MEEEIITKLKSALSEPIEKECQVVYILAEIRKLVERLKGKTNFPVLNFYGNWVLHSKIDDTSAIRPLLEKIEQSIINKNYDVWAVWAMIDFEEFCREIGLFLNKQNINNPFADRKYWEKFRKLLVDILIDCPLKPNYGDMDEFYFIKSSDINDIDFMIKFKNHLPMRGSFSFLNAEKIFEKANQDNEIL